jgi:predicted ATPase with chaperone activity
VLRIARTIADLDASSEIGTMHVAEAIQYRCDPLRLTIRDENAVTQPPAEPRG